MQRIRRIQEPILLAKHNAFIYQNEAALEIRDLEYAGIFHEQGLGKTKIAIDIMLYWLDKKCVDTVLFIVKKALVINWIRELKKHTSITPRILSQDRKNNYYVFNSSARVMITHYEAIKSESDRFEIFLKSRDVAAILDESAKIKNPKSELTQSLFKLSKLFKKRLIMTGTPVANRPYDLWAQIYFLDQGKSLGNQFSKFKRELDLSNKLSNDIDSQQIFESNLIDLNRKIAQFTVRETKDNGIINLPSKTIRAIYTDWEPIQYEIYKQIKEEMKVIIVKEGLPTEDVSEAILKRLLRLVQVASNPRLIDQNYSNIPGKFEPLRNILQDIIDSNEKCIIWTYFTENVEWLAFELKLYGTCKVHGKMDMESRTKSIDKFMEENNYKIFIATPGAAKEGLTLTVANHSIFYDRSFSLDDYLQAQDRIHRISQNKDCIITNMIMKDSVDEWVDVLLNAKHLAAQVAQGDISPEYYNNKMEYNYGDILKEILGIKQEREDNNK